MAAGGGSSVFLVGGDGREVQQLAALADCDVSVLAGGEEHCMALTTDGRLFSWGKNADGQLGSGDRSDQAEARHIDCLDAKVLLDVACGARHTVAVTDRGEAFAWGDGADGQLGLCTPESLSTDPDTGEDRWALRNTAVPRLMKQLRGVRIVQVAAGDTHTLLLSELGELYAAGRSAGGRAGPGTRPAVCPGSQHSLVATAGGQLWSWGCGAGGQLGHGDWHGAAWPRHVAGIEAGLHVSGVAGGRWFSLALTDDGEVLTAGVAPGEVCHVSAGAHAAAAVCSDGSAFVWGQNGVPGTAGVPRSGEGAASPSSPAKAGRRQPGTPSSGGGASPAMSSSLDGPLDLEQLLSPGARSPSSPSFLGGSPVQRRVAARRREKAAATRVGQLGQPGRRRPVALASCSGAFSTLLLAAEEGCRCGGERLHNGPPGWRGGGGLPAYINAEEVSLIRRTAAGGGAPAVALMREMEGVLGSPAIFNGSFRPPRGAVGASHRAGRQEGARGGAVGIDAAALDAGYQALLALFTASRRGSQRPLSAIAHPLARAAQRCLVKTGKAGPRGERVGEDHEREALGATSPEALRYLPLLLHSPLLSEATEHSRSLLVDIAARIEQLPAPAKRSLVDAWAAYPPELLGGRLVRMLTRQLGALLRRAARGLPAGKKLGPTDLQDVDDYGRVCNGPVSGLAALLGLLKAASDANLGGSSRAAHRATSGAPGEAPDGAQLGSSAGAALPSRAFYVDGIADTVDLSSDYLCWMKPEEWMLPSFGLERLALGGGGGSEPFSFCSHPFLLDPLAKRQVVQISAALSMGREVVQSLVGAEALLCVLQVRRSHLLEDSAKQLLRTERFADLRKPLRVQFLGEEGVDQGGVTKELLSLLLRELLLPRHRLFAANSRGRALWFWQAERGPAQGRRAAGVGGAAAAGTGDGLAEAEASRVLVEGGRLEGEDFSLGLEEGLRLAGLVVGLSVYNGIQCDVRFPPAFYKQLLGLRTTFHDLASFDPDLHDSLSQVLRYPGDVEVDMCMSFVAPGAGPGREDVALAPGGADVPVTRANRAEFAEAYADYVLRRRVLPELRAFRLGFTVCLSPRTLQLFNEEELELLVCGTPHLDFHALEAGTEYEGGFSAQHPTVRQFWRFVHRSAVSVQRSLLSFVTGSDRAPLGGLGKLRLLVQRAGPDTDRLPTAQTCFNTLLVPEYSSYEKLSRSLLRALEHSQGFGLQ
eukprot:jgi/Tetstr1/441350/TSEL_029601.t1